MSIEIELYPQKATKIQLVDFLLKNSFIKCDFIFSKSTINNIHFSWFEDNDFMSFDGVEATIFKISKLRQKELNCCQWALHTRTRIWASNYDLAKQNEIIKHAREQFAGYFINDTYGKNKFNILPKNLGHPIENGLFVTYEAIRRKINDIESCINNFKDPLQDNIDNEKNKEIKNLLQAIKPSFVLYNSLIPFAISSIEYFFKQTFLILLKYDNNTNRGVSDKTLKIQVSDISKLTENIFFWEELMAKEYSFQNINDINKAFKHYLSIDIVSIISHKRKIMGKSIRISEGIVEILEKRHDMIHAYRFEQDVSKEKLIEYFEIVKTLIDEIVIYLEKAKKIKIRKYGGLKHKSTYKKKKLKA